MRAAALALREAEAQTSLLTADVAPQAPSEAEIAALTRLERRIGEVVKLVAAGFDENEIVVARKVDPSKAATY